MTVRVIACGNPDAGDDAAGPLAVRAAAPRLAALGSVEVLEVRTPARLLDVLDGGTEAVVVDAVTGGGEARPPGTLLRAELEGGRLPATVGRSLSSHGLGVAAAVALAAATGAVHRLVFLGVEAAAAGLGEPPSAAVAEALPRLADAVVAEARRLAGERD